MEKQKQFKLLVLAVTALVLMAAPSSARAASMASKIALRVNRALKEKVAQSVAVAVVKKGQIVYLKGFGSANPNSLFDLASLSKPTATAMGILKLAEQGELDLYAPVVDYLPAFKNCIQPSHFFNPAIRGESLSPLFLEIPDVELLAHFTGVDLDLCAKKTQITLEHLLRHRSGLNDSLSAQDRIAEALSKGQDPDLLFIEMPNVAEPGVRLKYADVNFVILRAVLDSILKKKGLDTEQWLLTEVLQKSGMSTATFKPDSSAIKNVIPVAPKKSEDYVNPGEPHDPIAWRMKKFSGNAGLFASAKDLAEFSKMLLAKGSYKGVEVFRPETIELMQQDKTLHDGYAMPAGKRRGLGWDTESATSKGIRGTMTTGYGHTGYTGTGIWVDPNSQTALIVLSNRLYYGKVKGSKAQVQSFLTDLSKIAF